MKRVEQCASRWKKAYEKDSVIGLMDNRKGAQKNLKRVLTPEETIQRQQARITVLEEQVEVLKKLEKIEGRCFIRKNKLTTAMKFQWIQTLVSDNNFSRYVSYFCSLLEVSKSGYIGMYSVNRSEHVEKSKTKHRAISYEQLSIGAVSKRALEVSK